MSTATTRATTTNTTAIGDSHTRSPNIMEWSTSNVCSFVQEIIGSRHAEALGTILKHQVSGVDLVEMTE
jgi:hypothetical protein